MSQTAGPICQSCGMPMTKHEEFADQDISSEYCTYCMENGRFTEPNLTKEEVIDKVSKIWAEHQNISLEQAKGQIGPMISQLKRWM